jgi:type I site-specific restriction-modification system R (restriction) subunit
MAKRGQTMMYKTLLRKLKIEQHLLFFLCNKCTLKDICETFPVFENKQTTQWPKRKRPTGQTMIYKTLLRTQKIDEY